MAANEGPIVYRAEFRQPIGHLNPMGLRVSAPVVVEVFSVGLRGNRWKARTLDNEQKPARVLTYEDKSDLVGTSAQHCQRLVASYFEEQLHDWRQKDGYRL